MSSLLSQSSNPVPPAPILPMLTGAADYPIYMTKLRNHLKTNFGKTGQNILKSTMSITLSNPGDRPHYNDPRLHPDTNEPIPGTRMYEQEQPTDEQAADPTFDPKTLALTKAAAADLRADRDNHSKELQIYETKLAKYRAEDDQLLNFLTSTQSFGVIEALKSNALTPPFDNLPDDCVCRSQHYLNIMDNQYSKGNSTQTVNEITKFLLLQQEPGESMAAWTNRGEEQFARIKPILSAATTVEQLLCMLQCMVYIKGTDRRIHCNLRAIEIHVQTYPAILHSLAHYEDLRASLLAGVDNDLSQLDEPISAQSSAFSASVSPPPSALAATTIPPNQKSAKPKSAFISGAQRAGRTDHCTYCLAQFTKYYYHKVADCNLKKQGITATTKTIKPTTTANLATTTPPTEAEIASYLAANGWVVQFADGTKSDEA